MAGVYFSQRRIGGFSASFILLALAIASLVISVQDMETFSAPNCGVPGYPPLRQYIFGTGLAYLIISVSFTITSIMQNRAGIFRFLSGISSTFIFAWMIVGAVSLWRDGYNCQPLNYPVWAMGMADVICSIILVCCGTYVTYRTGGDDE